MEPTPVTHRAPLVITAEVTGSEGAWLATLSIGAQSGWRDSKHRVAVPGEHETQQAAFAAAAQQLADKLV